MTNSYKTRWAILGTGAIAARFADDMRHSRAGRIAAVGARSADKAAAFAAALGPDVIAGTIAALLARNDIDAVYLATPNATHADLTLAAFDAGKPVMVEKPFAVSAAKARQVADAARSAGLLLMEAMWTRFTPGIIRLKRVVDEGGIGTIRRFDASLSFHHAIPPGSPLADPATGGALLDLGVYPVSLAVHLMGSPRSVQATMRRLPSGAIVAAGLLLHYDDALATLSCGFDAEGANEATITGTHGIATAHRSMLCSPMISLRRTPGEVSAAEPISFRPSSAKPRFAAVPALVALARGIKTQRYPTLFEGSGLHYQADHFSACLARGLTESPVMPLDQSIAVLDIIDWAASAGVPAGLS